MRLKMKALGREKEVTVSLNKDDYSNYISEDALGVEIGIVNEEELLNIKDKAHINILEIEKGIKILSSLKDGDDIIESLRYSIVRLDRFKGKNKEEIIKILENMLEYDKKLHTKADRVDRNNLVLTVEEDGMHSHFLRNLDEAFGELIAIQIHKYTNMNTRLYPEGTKIRNLFNQLELEFPRVKNREVDLYCALTNFPRRDETIKELLKIECIKEKVLIYLNEYFNTEDPIETMEVYSHNIYKYILEFVIEDKDVNKINYNNRTLTVLSGKGSNVEDNLNRHVNVECEIDGHRFDVVVQIGKFSNPYLMNNRDKSNNRKDSIKKTSIFK